MPFEEFCKILGLALRSKGWLIEDDGSDYDYPDTSLIKVDGPYVDENANLICAVIIPDELECELKKLMDKA